MIIRYIQLNRSIKSSVKQAKQTIFYLWGVSYFTLQGLAISSIRFFIKLYPYINIYESNVEEKT